MTAARARGAPGKARGRAGSRDIAASILVQVARGRRLDVAWENSPAPRSPERAWLRTLVYGTVRLQGRLDYIVRRAANRAPEDMDPEVCAVLRMGAYQILQMEGVPDYAAVSESVGVVKRRRRPAAGLVNAVLRAVATARPGREVFPGLESDPEAHLSSWGSHPLWLVRRWIKRYGVTGAQALVEANNRDPEVYFRPVGTGGADAEQALLRAGMGERAGHGSIRLGRGIDPARALARGTGVIQDPAASLVVDYVGVRRASPIADLCAAPGGKALALSAHGSVLASDLSRARIARLVAGIGRLGARVWPVVADARRPPLLQAPVVVLDVPCTGTGTLRRHPDGRWRVRRRHLSALVRTQRAILEGAASVVTQGGIMVYATCSLEPEENWNQVRSFMARHRDFQIEAGPAPVSFLNAHGCLEVLPQDSGFDGAFAVRLRRGSPAS